MTAKTHHHAIPPRLWQTLLPFLTWLPLLNRRIILGDIIAGITGAILVLPQGVAYAMIAGLPPEYGLYAAIIPAIIAALFGSSYHLISGPTVALSVVLFTTVGALAPPGAEHFIGSPEFIKMTLTVTLLAGLFQLALGLARLGTLVNFVSHSVVIGFTAGAAVLIATSQLKNILDVKIPAGDSFIHTWIDLINALPQTNVYALLIALLSLFTAVIFKIYLPRWPGMLFAMMIGSIIAGFIGTQTHAIQLVPAIPATLPPLSMPNLSATAIRELTDSALAIALLGLVEAVSIARAVAIRSRQLIDGNQEFIGQGLSNIIGAFFSCYAASGSFTRTGVNYEAGAKTPLAAISAAIALALIMLILAPLTAYVPIPSMAGILLVIAYGLFDFHHIKMIIKTSASETAVLLVTFLATLFLELEFAIYAGVLLSLVIYLNRTSRPQLVTLSPDPSEPNHRLININKKPLKECPQLKIIRIDGSLFFGAVNYVEKALQDIQERNILIVGSGINFIDIAGAQLLAHHAKQRRSNQGSLYLTNIKAKVSHILQRGDYLKDIHPECIFDTKVNAIQIIFERLDKPQCRICQARIFKECHTIISSNEVGNQTAS